MEWNCDNTRGAIALKICRGAGERGRNSAEPTGWCHNDTKMAAAACKWEEQWKVHFHFPLKKPLFTLAAGKALDASYCIRHFAFVTRRRANGTLTQVKDPSEIITSSRRPNSECSQEELWKKEEKKSSNRICQDTAPRKSARWNIQSIRPRPRLSGRAWLTFGQLFRRWNEKVQSV